MSNDRGGNPVSKAYRDLLIPAILGASQGPDERASELFPRRTLWEWVEAYIDDYGDGLPHPTGRWGTFATAPAVEANNHPAHEGQLVWLRLAADRDIPFYEFDACCGEQATTYTIGNSSDTTFTINHSLGTQDLIILVRESGPSYEVVYPTVSIPTPDTVILTFATPPTTDEFRVIIAVGGAPPFNRPPPQRVTVTTTPIVDFVLLPDVTEVIFTLATIPATIVSIIPPAPLRPTELTISNKPESLYVLTVPPESLLGTDKYRIRTPTATSPSKPLRPGESLTITYDPLPSGTERWLTKPRPAVPPWRPTWTGTVNNPALPIGEFPVVLLPILTGHTTLTGFPSTFPLGVPLVIKNPSDSGFNLTIDHDGTGSDLDFDLSTGADLTLSPGESLAIESDGVKLTDSGGSLSLAAGTVERVKVTKTHAQLAAASTSNDVEIYLLPARGVIHGAIIKHSQSFTGGAITAYTLSVGWGSSPQGLTEPLLDVFAAPGDQNFRANTGTSYNQIPKPIDFGSATSIRLYASSVGANLNAATAGSVDVWLFVSDPLP